LIVKLNYSLIHFNYNYYLIKFGGLTDIIIFVIEMTRSKNQIEFITCWTRRIISPKQQPRKI
jgi:hypothetical protein